VKDDRPLVSVVLPTYNRASLLRRSIDSVLEQTWQDFELIVVDDGSTDGTRETVAGTPDPRVRYVARESNGGVAAARNTGVRAATGRYLAFHDSDDEWLPEKLARQVQALQPLDETCMSVCGVRRTFPAAGGAGAGGLTYPRSASDWNKGLDWSGVLASGVAYTQSWLVPRRAVVDAGGFDERLCIWDDWDLLIRLSRRLPIRTLPEPLVISERGADSLSADPQRFVRDMPVILEKHGAEAKQRPPLLAELHFLHALQLCKVVRVREARAALWRCLKLAPTHAPAWRLLMRTLLGSAHIRRRFGAPAAQGEDHALGWALVLTVLDRVLQRLVPPVPSRIAYVSFPDYTDSAFYVFRHALRTRNGLEHVWLVRDASARRRIERDFAQAVAEVGTTGHTLRVEQRASLAGYWSFLRSRYVFHTHGAYRFRDTAWRRDVVCLWHGMPIKCVGLLNRITPNPYPTFGTMHLATSAFFRDIVAAAFAADTAVVKLCSLPRCDALLHESARQTPEMQVRERLAVAPDQRLVLWLPTYRAEGPQSQGSRPRSFLDDVPSGTVEAMERAAAATGSVVLAKLHPRDPLNDHAPPWPFERLRLLRANAWTALDLQLYDLIAASDALISDVSSVLIDYSITRGPIGILGFDPATYTRELTFPFEKLTATGRFDLLGDARAVERFLQRVRDGGPTDGAPTFLYDRFDLPGAEQVLREVHL